MEFSFMIPPTIFLFLSLKDRLETHQETYFQIITEWIYRASCIRNLLTKHQHTLNY